MLECERSRVESVIIDKKGVSKILDPFCLIPSHVQVVRLKDGVVIEPYADGRQGVHGRPLEFDKISKEIQFLFAIYDVDGDARVFLFDNSQIDSIECFGESADDTNFQPILLLRPISVDIFESLDLVDFESSYLDRQRRPSIDSDSFWIVIESEFILEGIRLFHSVYVSARDNAWTENFCQRIEGVNSARIYGMGDFGSGAIIKMADSYKENIDIITEQGYI